MRAHCTPLAALFTLCVGACGGSGSTALSTPPPTTTLTISFPTNPLPSGTSTQATAYVTPPSGTPTPATDVTWGISNPSVATISATGLITGKLAGTSLIQATSAGLTAKLGITVVPGAPTAVIIYQGNGQQAVAGTQVSDPLCTNVKDAAGNLIIGAVVTYTVMTGGGTIAEPTSPKTANDGIARSGLWTLGFGSATQTVLATAPGATPVTFTASTR
jgi:Bacterial Ig-like domain (group 2)